MVKIDDIVKNYVVLDAHIKKEETALANLRKERKEQETLLVGAMKGEGVEEVVADTGVVFKIGRKLMKKKPE